MKLFLVGFMGSGKSFLGYSLAQKLQIPFIDLDNEIEKSTGCSVSEFFRIHGEAEFRHEENRLLKELGIQMKNFVMATGGGTPCFYDNMHWMNKIGITMYMRVSVKTLVSRLKADKQQRPLLSSLPDNKLSGFITLLFRERERYYKLSKLQFTQGNSTSEVLLEKIAARLRS